MALTQGQLNYWKSKTKRPNLTMGQAAYQRAQAKMNPAAAPSGPSPATKTWLLPNQSGLSGQQQLYQAYMAKNPTAKLPTPSGGVPPAVDATAPSAVQDASYFAQVARQRYDAQQALIASNQESASALTNYNENLRRAQELTPRERETSVNQANKAGLLYSGTLGRNLGDIQVNALRREGGLTSDYNAGEAARAAARNAIEQGLPLSEAAALAEAADRQIGRDTTAAADRSLVRESTIPPDALDAGVDVGTPSPKTGVRANTQSTPKYLPKGYSNWSLARRRAYWNRKRARR